MPVYEYIGIDSKGKRAAGVVDAEADRAARAKLRRMGIFPTELALQGAMKQKVGLGMNIDFSKYFQRISVQEIAVMTRQLSALLAAQIPLVEALNALVDQVENTKLRTILSQVRETVTGGGKLSDAMRQYPKVFNEIYVNMIDAGENSGALEIVTQRLADFAEGQAKLRGKVIGAMIYPAIMSVVGVALVIGLVTLVVPKVTAIFEDTGATLPLPTRMLMGTTHLLTNYWWLLLLIIGGAVIGFQKYLKTPKGRSWWDQKKLKLPVFGNLNRMVAVSRFTRTLATLLASGVPLLNALDIVRNVMDNTELKRVVEETRDNVREGQSVSEPLKKSGHFPPLVTHMIGIGEKTGEMERMLERVADTYDGQVETALSAMTSLLEPIMILAMAGVVGFVVMSILLLILQLNQLG